MLAVSGQGLPPEGPPLLERFGPGPGTLEARVRVKLYDEIGYLVCDLELDRPPPPVLVWGERVFVRQGAGVYRLKRHEVIFDTPPSGSPRMPRDGEDQGETQGGAGPGGDGA